MEWIINFLKYLRYPIGVQRLLLLMIFSFALVLPACTFGRQLKKVKEYPEWRKLEKMVIKDGFLYGANGYGGLLILDVSDPLASVQVYKTPDSDRSSHISEIGYADAITVDDNFVYLVDDVQGLQIIDVSDAQTPRVVGSYKPDGYALNADIQYPYAYLTVVPQLHLIDISDPNDLKLVQYGELHLIDISDPNDLKLVYTLQSGHYIYDVAVSGKYAYVTKADEGDKMVILDVSNPTSPKEISTTSVQLTADIVLQGDYAFVANYIGLQILDISDPYSPTHIASYETPGHATTVVLKENFAYIGDTWGVEVIDISDVHSPRRAGYSKLSQVHDVAVVGDYIYVASDAGFGFEDGLVIYEHP